MCICIADRHFCYADRQWLYRVETFADRLWARRQFWLAMLVFSLTASVISAPLLLRTLRSDGYGFAIDRTVLTDSAIDLLNLFSPIATGP